MINIPIFQNVKKHKARISLAGTSYHWHCYLKLHTPAVKQTEPAIGSLGYTGSIRVAEFRNFSEFKKLDKYTAHFPFAGL